MVMESLQKKLCQNEEACDHTKSDTKSELRIRELEHKIDLELTAKRRIESQIEKMNIKVLYCPGTESDSDIFTKMRKDNKDECLLSIFWNVVFHSHARKQNRPREVDATNRKNEITKQSNRKGAATNIQIEIGIATHIL